jgi:hypothetical protein
MQNWKVDLIIAVLQVAILAKQVTDIFNFAWINTPFT